MTTATYETAIAELAATFLKTRETSQVYEAYQAQKNLVVSLFGVSLHKVGVDVLKAIAS